MRVTGDGPDAFLVSFTSYSWFRYQKRSSCGHAGDGNSATAATDHQSSAALTTRVAKGRTAIEGVKVATHGSMSEHSVN